MNRISRRSAEETAEALLEVGRTEPVLHYDVELGLARHHAWLRNEAPLPEWASAGFGTAAKSFLPVAIKTLVSAVLVGGLAVVAWQMRERPQPSAAAIEQSAAVVPRVRDVTASETEAWMGPKPMPVPTHALPGEQPVRRSSDKRTTRSHSAQRESATARAARAESALPRAEPADATAIREEPVASATASTSVERATPAQVATAPERKPSVAANDAQPAAEPRAQRPDDLAEMQQVAKAEQLLARSPERALALVRRGDQRFAQGYFQQERAYIAIMALIRLGRIEEARARAASFGKQFPALPYGARIRSALEAREAAARGAAARDSVR